ncbi:MAG: DUF2330 domain-containing protein [Pseudomonadota bacterium]|nr:DUF2330 domain-containing protein [Pseudomonadota bacterium]
MLLTLLLATVTPSHAFCGTFVGAPGAALTNQSSRVVIGRDGDHTVLTLAADYTGDLADFALVLPVPSILGPNDVSVGDSTLIEWVDAYSTPRAVAYTCDDLFDLQQSGFGCGYTMGCSDSSFGGMSDVIVMADDSVTVEAAFTAAGYEIVVLSAEESSGLFSWLQANGYEVPRGGDEILQEYIDAGSYFLAAKVSLDSAPSGNTWLTPLRLSYTSEFFGLPIRIGTISANGPQEVIVYTITDTARGGEVGIANYPEITLESECMWRPEADEDMGSWYAREVEDAVAAAGGAGWIREFSADLVPTEGTGYHCDPCTAEPAIPGGSFAPFGLNSESAHLTRIRMRYDASTADEDLSLYESGILGASSQLRYIGYDHALEFVYPVCHEGWVADPGECPSSYVGGCTMPAPMSGLGVLAALLLLRRRSS